MQAHYKRVLIFLLLLVAFIVSAIVYLHGQQRLPEFSSETVEDITMVYIMEGTAKVISDENTIQDFCQSVSAVRLRKINLDENILGAQTDFYIHLTDNSTIKFSLCGDYIIYNDKWYIITSDENLNKYWLLNLPRQKFDFDTERILQAE